MKTYTTEVFLGLESLYKPSGFPSFEIISYIMDSNLKNIEKVLNVEDLNKIR